MRIKSGPQGARVYGIRPEIVLALNIASAVFERRGVQMVITSVADGQHSRGSLHYAGCATDLRRPEANAEAIVADLKDRLGDDYDVVLEADHIHVEFQPKVAY